MSEGRTQWRTERWIRAAAAVIADAKPFCPSKERSEPDSFTSRPVFRLPPMRFISLTDTVRRATAAPRAGEPAEVAWTGQDASWAPSWGGVPGMAEQQEEALRNSEHTGGTRPGDTLGCPWKRWWKWGRGQSELLCWALCPLCPGLISRWQWVQVLRCNKLLKFRVKLKPLQGHLVELQLRWRPSQEQNFMEISLSAYRSRKVSVLDFSWPGCIIWLYACLNISKTEYFHMRSTPPNTERESQACVAMRGKSAQGEFPLRRGRSSWKGMLPADVFVFQLLFVTLSALFRNRTLLEKSKPETLNTIRIGGRKQKLDSVSLSSLFVLLLGNVMFFFHVVFFSLKLCVFMVIWMMGHNWIRLRSCFGCLLISCDFEHRSATSDLWKLFAKVQWFY